MPKDWISSRRENFFPAKALHKLLAASAIACFIAGMPAAANAQQPNPFFSPGNLVVSRSVYAGNSSTVAVGQTLPPGCVPGTVKVPLIAGGTAKVAVACSTAIANGNYPTVFNNNTTDGSFGVTSPIFLDQITTGGALVNTLSIDPNQIVTSFSSKSELALNESVDGKSITFVGYQGGPGFVTSPNQLDVSNSNTPGVVDPTNPVVSNYYRSVAEVDAFGNLKITSGNAYSGNNGRAAIKANWLGNSLYYMAGNNNNGGLSKTQLTTTQVGVNLVNSTGMELLFPSMAPPLPPNINKIGDFEVTQIGYTTADKPGKDDNFRGLTIFNNTLYATKGSGGNGINTVYQIGNSGTLPTPADAPGGKLLNVPITVLPGFSTTLASGTGLNGPGTVYFPFGIWFANANTLYVADEGDGTMANAGSDPLSGLQKWSLVNGTWQLDYVLQNGLGLGGPYTVGTYYPIETDGLRNISGRVNANGTVTVWGVTSTVSTSGDQGADPNNLVAINDVLSATTLPASETFTTLRSASYGEVLRGVSSTPGTTARGH